jgi:hypothetical protein
MHPPKDFIFCTILFTILKFLKMEFRRVGHFPVPIEKYRYGENFSHRKVKNFHCTGIDANLSHRNVKNLHPNRSWLMISCLYSVGGFTVW